MSLKTFRKFYDLSEAHIILSRLRSHGIEGFISNENTAGLLWHLNIGMGGVNLMIHENDFKAAEIILSEETPVEPDTDHEFDSTTLCHRCGSSNVYQGPVTLKKVNWFRLILSMLMGTVLPSSEQGFHCFACGYDFKELSPEPQSGTP